MKNNASITFYGGAGTVTGSNFLLTLGDKNILIDCGLTQGEEYCDDCNYDAFDYDPSSIDVLVATHAHADHIGRIPKLVRDGFQGTIYSTKATYDLSEVMFADSVNILMREAKEKNREPLYEKTDVEKAFSLWKILEYHTLQQLPRDITVSFKDAGHILGSAIAEFSYQGKKIVFTGDLGNSPSPLLRDTEEIQNADYMVMESVYGNKNHEAEEDRSRLLKQALIDTHGRGGVLMIPSFSIERTQVLLYLINNLIEDNEVPNIPVFLDSPLAIKVTDIYKKYTHLFNDAVQEEIRGGDDIFDFPQFTETERVTDSKAILGERDPKVIIAGSGMSTGGRILHHEKHYLGDKNNILLLVGYQAVGTLGRKIEDGAKEVEIFDERVPVRAEVRKIEGFSAHKDSEHLVDFVASTSESLKEVFVAMGEPKASLFLVQRLRDYLGVKARAPQQGDTVMLDI